MLALVIVAVRFDEARRKVVFLTKPLPGNYQVEG